jgi:hypothetical protein
LVCLFKVTVSTMAVSMTMNMTMRVPKVIRMVIRMELNRIQNQVTVQTLKEFQIRQRVRHTSISRLEWLGASCYWPRTILSWHLVSQPQSNKLLDASGRSVFRNLIRPAMPD